jgi:hypothetical protein
MKYAAFCAKNNTHSSASFTNAVIIFVVWIYEVQCLWCCCCQYWHLRRCVWWKAMKTVFFPLYKVPLVVDTKNKIKCKFRGVKFPKEFLANCEFKVAATRNLPLYPVLIVGVFIPIHYTHNFNFIRTEKSVTTLWGGPQLLNLESDWHLKHSLVVSRFQLFRVTQI